MAQRRRSLFCDKNTEKFGLEVHKIAKGARKIGKGANHAVTTECTKKKHDNVRIKRIVLDVHDVIVDSKKGCSL